VKVARVTLKQITHRTHRIHRTTNKDAWWREISDKKKN